MTQQETRQMGIEFERRVQTMYPQALYEEKLDSETIYSYLNEFQKTYIKQAVLAQDLAETNSITTKISNVIRTLTQTVSIDKSALENDSNIDMFKLPDDYLHYIRSVSLMNKNYKSPVVRLNYDRVSNIFVKALDINEKINAYYNKNSIIRNPLATVQSYDNDQVLKLYHDSYSNITKVDITYVRLPHNFDVIGFEDNSNSVSAKYSYCELPYDCFDELVSGAVNMYMMNYKMALQGGNLRQLRRELKEDTK